MHKIKILELRFSNVMSYGGNQNVIRFNNGITWLKGLNGVGKSSILEALNYVFFGRPYRKKLTLPHFINSRNKKSLVVEVDFEKVDAKGTYFYTVKRGIKSNFFVINKNNSPDNLAASTTQNIFEKEILGFDSTLFTNVICLNTLETEPFLDMEPSAKRGLIESIISLDIKKIKEKNSSELSTANTRFTVASNDVESYKKKIDQLNGLLSSLENEKKEGIEDIKKQISSQEKLIKEKASIKVDLETEIKKITEDEKKLIEQIKTFQELDNSIFNNIQMISIINDIEVLNNNSYTKDFESNENELKSTTTKYLTKKEEYNIKLNEFKLLRNVDSQIITLNTDIAIAESKKIELEALSKNIEVGVPCTTCGKPSTKEDKEKLLSSYRDSYTQNKKKIKECQVLIDQLKKEQDIYISKKTIIDELLIEINQLTPVISNLTSTDIRLKNEIKKTSDSISTKTLQLRTIDKDIDINKSSIETLISKNKDLEQKKLESTKYKESLEKVKEYLSTKKSELNSVAYIIVDSTNKIQEFNNTIEKRKQETGADPITLTKKQLHTAMFELDDSYLKIKQYSDDIQIFKYISLMMSDEGMKKTVIGTFVPVLNIAIEKNLKTFDLPFSIEFDEALNYSFINEFGTAESYHGLSQGQKRKLHFSISMAFRDFVSMIGDFNINILFLDEFLDISVDEPSLDSMVEMLKNKVSDIGGIYLMTHRGENYSNDWDHIIEILHDGNYSSISVLK